MRRHYVYYRVHEPDLADACATVAALQRELRAAHPGLEAELLRRPGAAEGFVTLMEVYAKPPGLEAELGAAIEVEAAARLGRVLVGPRHVEVFETLDGG
ncbi:MAG: DUF4936 family protein [Burkholderiales bacterium]|nr:DUF4936 family protein [Burkholderiales bacterium]MDE2456009.1 DUF4936 family protein [Burkholderiales bacterium]